MHLEQAMEQDKKYIIQSYGRTPILLTKGKGVEVEDDNGKKYIDFTSGIGVNALGFCPENWANAVTTQLNILQHTSNLYYTEPCIQVAKKLCEKSGMQTVLFFAIVGAEANEGVIKAARKYGFTKYQKTKIVSLENSFHGRTMAALSATGQPAYHQHFFPFVDGFVFAKANDLQDTLAKLTDDVCAVMLEVVQGEGGVIALDKEYVQTVAAHCQKNDILVIVDEVQETGIGRTGTFFGYQQYGIQPDLVYCAKGLGGGLPIGAVLFGERTKDILQKGDHGSTFGGNPVVCAGANVILDTIDDAFLQEVSKKGAYLKQKIKEMPHVINVDGLGMMLAIALDIDIQPVIDTLMKNGLLVLSAKTKIRLLPRLNISWELCDKGLSILENTLKLL